MVFRLPKDKEMTLPILEDFLSKHRQEVTRRYEKLQQAYVSDHDILHTAKKADWKPDNRIAVNFPKYIIDTMNGFFIGNPIKVIANDPAVSEFVEFIDQYNDQDDNNAELSKICSIFGHGFEMYYTDEAGELCITYLSPIESFMIYDESIVERSRFFVRRYKDYDNEEYGSISDVNGVRNFKVTGGLQWLDEWQPHNFTDVPATEFLENAERQGLFEPVMSMVNAYNKTISEKANDIDYFADAYMKILGPELDADGTRHIRDNRLINFSGDDAENVVVEFMEKPSGDAAQENHLSRLERLIFQIAMVANISDENFGASSGVALKYKLQAMSNLEKTKERKFASGMNRRYKLLFSHPVSKVPADAWVPLNYQFTPNIPTNLLEEAQIAAQMEGITSHGTQLRVLSCVDNVEDELKRIEEENKPDENNLIDRLTFSFKDHDEAAEDSSEGEPEDVTDGTEAD